MSSLKTLVALLLVGTGLYHLFVAFTGAPPALKTGLAVFGAGFSVAGLWVLIGGRTGVLVGMVLAATGLGVGGQAYLANGGPVALPVMFAVDVAILVTGGLWLATQRKRA